LLNIPLSLTLSLKGRGDCLSRVLSHNTPDQPRACALGYNVCRPFGSQKAKNTVFFALSVPKILAFSSLGIEVIQASDKRQDAIIS